MPRDLPFDSFTDTRMASLAPLCSDEEFQATSTSTPVQLVRQDRKALVLGGHEVRADGPGDDPDTRAGPGGVHLLAGVTGRLDVLRLGRSHLCRRGDGCVPRRRGRQESRAADYGGRQDPPGDADGLCAHEISLPYLLRLANVK